MDLAALGAFLSGAGAVLSALLSMRFARKRAEAECERRIAEVKQAIHEGFEMREER
jgi:hypothetical protein